MTMPVAESKFVGLRQYPLTSTVEELLTILQQCRFEKNVPLALYLHAHLCQSGLDSQTTLGNYLISLLLDVERLCLAQQVFEKLVLRNESSWNRLILGYFNQGKSRQAILLYERMLKSGYCCLNEYAAVALMMACVETNDSETSQAIFVEIARQGLMERNVYIGSTLVDMYANCHEVALAQEIFDKLGARNVVAWNALISGYINNGCGEEVLSCLQKMEPEGIAPDVVTLVCSLKACGTLGCLSRGEELHIEIVKKGLLEGSVFVGSSLINMYIKCGALETARAVFEKLATCNVVMWNALISGYAESSQAEESLDCFKRMQGEGFCPDEVTFISTLKSCRQIGSIEMGQKIHRDILMKGMEKSPLIGGSLVDMYAQCGLLVHAEIVFGKLPIKDVVVWTALIAGYVEHADCANAVRVFAKMHSEKISPGVVTFSCVLKACNKEGDRLKGLALHTEVIKKGLERESLVSRSLVDFYAKCGLLTEAENVLNIFSHQDVFCFSTLVVGYIEQGLSIEALQRFKRLQQEDAAPDVVTLVCVLKACGMTGAVDDGQEIHTDLCKKGLESDPFVSSTLADMYSKCGFFADAEKINNKTIASWNDLISGLVDYGQDEEALNCFRQREHEGFFPDALTFIFSLKACCNLGATVDGQIIHAELVNKGLEMDLLISNTLLDMYAKFNCLAEALDVFNRCASKTVVLWTALIAGCIENGHGEQALYYFDHMQRAGVPPSDATFSCVLRACGTVKAMEKGEKILTEILKKGMLEDSISLGSTVVDMYSKQGYLARAHNVFSKLPVQDSVSWTVLITGYVEHGACEIALSCFEQMQHGRVLPIVSTFVSILKACGRIGALDKGQNIHSAIVRRGIEKESYIGNTLVDMYAKCGLLAEARELFNGLPAQSVVSWTALIKGYMEFGSSEETLLCLEQMEQEKVSQGPVALVGSLKACGNIAALARGREIHSQIAKKGLDGDHLVGNTLIDLYAKCGALAEAEDIFCRLLTGDVLSWTSLIIGYSQAGLSENVICLFHSMLEEGVEPDATTFLAILNALSHTGLVDKGQMYFEMVCSIDGFVPNLEHYSCLVDLLSRAGLIEKAVKLIMEMPVHPGMVVWLTLLGACRKLGNLNSGRDAFLHAVNLNKNDSAAYVCLANIYADCDGADGEERVIEVQNLAEIRRQGCG
ncbi:hypothetical protein GOP47_0018358 [Adiantum capillus-veneris]|uniref:Pentatricopeptide repeat-containing protein n=1 Tax=Adiantum capillus-veneris TaxID=13818 RepID=A0A9D4UHC3_ADICA|nr:hypothetical protein GOP47_0018358 [Adiantum capillus-veneris]